MCAVSEAAITLANSSQDLDSLPSAKLETPLITIHSIFKSCAAKNRPAKDSVNKTSMEVNRVKSWDLSSDRSDLSLLSERLKGWTKTDPRMFIWSRVVWNTPLESISSPGPRRKRYWVGWFSTGFLSCVSPIKAKTDDRPCIFTVYETFKTFYILLKRELRTKRFRLSYARSITFIKYFIFASLSNKYE